jgi:hypothetical protein
MSLIRILPIISILFTVLLSAPVFAGGNMPRSRYLKEPAVKWENNLITGKLRNVPVKGLLEELLRQEGFDWEVIGNLKDTISVSFNHLTINESIRKILRLSRFNYALIVDEPEPHESNSSNLIKELTIYQNDQVVRFSRTAKQLPAQKKKKIKKAPNPGNKKATAALPSKPPAEKPKKSQTLPSGLTTEEISSLNKEMKAFADEMLAEKKITAEEYKELIEELEAEK